MEMEQSSSKADSSEDDGIVVKKKAVKLQIVDSDDDSGDLFSNNIKKDSESEIDNDEKCINSHKQKKCRVFIPKSDSDSEDETAADIFPEQFHQNQHRKDFTTLFKEKDLYDADGSGEEDDTLNDSEQYSKPQKSMGKHQKEKKLQRKSKTQAMSVMQQIHSETQRLVRESPVSLPYHKPRQRTLAEFLQRRKPVSVLGASTRLGLNLPTEKLTEVWKQLEEREKEAEEFYKSESDESEKESDPKKLELPQGQPSGTADSGIHSPQSPVTSPVENQDRINETDVSIQKEHTAIESQCNSSVVHVNATVITENNNPLRENSELCKDSTQFDIFQNPVLKTKAVVQGTIEDEIHKSVINSKNSEFGFNRSKMVEPMYMSSHNLNSTESNRTETDVNNVTSLSPENSVTQFYFISSSTKKCENESAIIKSLDENNLKTAAECIAVYGKPDIESNEAKDLYFAYANKEKMNSKYIIQKAIENENVEREMNSNEISNVTASMETQDLTLHWSETESTDTADVNPKITNLNLGIQTESKEKAKSEVEECLFALNHINHSESTNTNPADVGQSSSNIIGCGTDTQNFHLHYSESQSSNLYKEESDETGKCVVLPEAEEENAMDISLSKKESSFIEEAKEMRDGKDTFEQKNTKDFVQHCSKNELNSNSNAVQQDEKSRTEWFYNIEPPSDDSDDEKPPENQKLMNIAKNSFPGIGDITKIQPCLSDTPSGIIDLDEDVADKGGIVKFVQRFMKHSATNVKRKPPKRTAEISVVSAEKNTEGLETVHKDVVTILLGEQDPLEDPALAKPGAKLQRLKVELQQQMAQKRAEEWNKRQQEHKLDNEELDEDVLSDCGAKEEVEEEMTDEDTTASETEEEEEEEDDVPLIEKKRIKSTFVDDEAEESEDDEVHLGDDEDEEEDASVNVGNEIDEGTASSESSSSKKTKLERAKTFDLFASQEDSTTQEIKGDQDMELIGSLIPAYQPIRDITATPCITKEEEPKKSVFDLISPASDLTPLRSRSHLQSISQTPLTASISSCDRSPIISQPKRLFTDSEPASTQEHMDELLGLCSGKFSVSAQDAVCGGIEKLVDPAKGSKEELEQELLGLCSGKFTSLASLNTQATELSSKISAANTWKSLTIVSSDEEDENENLLKSRTQRKGIHKKLNFSDEENEETEEEELNDKDSIEEDSEDGNEDDEEKIIGYDSEENEVVIAPQEKKLSRKTMADYFENEAELSESDWDSADEDERGLNKLEKEEGDEDQLDQEAVKEQLGKIHMRRMLDEDKREVRLLQEIFFEDGELHSEGGGRERKFRWKNIDNIDDNELARRDTDDEGVDYDDEEDEAEWRRMRHERESFLQKLKEKTERSASEVLLEDEDSKLIKLGKAALKKIQRSNSQDISENAPTLKKSFSEPQFSPEHPFKLLTKRGSFLARGETALARIAQVASSSLNVVSRPKNTRNFVFAALSPEKAEEEIIEEKPVKAIKRSLSEITPPIVKRLRISNEHSRGKKLLDMLT